MANAAPRTVKFSKIGASVTGIVTSVDTEVQMAFDAENRPNGPRFDGNGNVVLGTTITMATTDDAGDPTENVVKLRVGDSIFTDKGKPVMTTTSGLAVAISEGVDRAIAAGLTKGDRDGLEVGDTIQVVYVSNEPAETEGYNPAKVYEVTVTPA